MNTSPYGRMMAGGLHLPPTGMAISMCSLCRRPVARRLTYFSGNEVPSSFTADDKQVLFSAHRQDLVTDGQFPSGVMTELYEAPVSGGRIGQVLPVPAPEATVSGAGDKIIYVDQKGYESDWRKHHTSSIARDIWVYDIPTGKYRQ